MVKKKTKKQYQNELLKNIFIIIFLIFVAIAAFVVVNYFMNNFTYEGVKFKTVKEGGLILYNTQLPIIYNNEKTKYNFYLRKDPRKLENVPFDGEINLVKNMVINATSDFKCNGNGIIAVANLVKLYEIIGTKVIKNETLGCDFSGRYMFLQIQEGNETKIEQTGITCYNINVNNCEILEGTEKFMVETFIEVNKLI